MADMLRSPLLHCYSVASPFRASTGSAFPGSHFRMRPSHLYSLTSNDAEFPTSKFWRDTPHAQPEIQDQVAVALGDGLKWWEKDLGATIKDLHSAQELTEAIASAKGKLVILEFFASWCGSCRALYPKLCKLAAEHQHIVFVKINFDENKALCKSLNVKVLPYFHFYRGTSEQLESFSCSLTKLQKLKDAIGKYSLVGDQHVSIEG